MKTLRRFVLLLVLLSLAGCSSLWPWGEKIKAAPSVSLADIELQGIKGLETIFRLKLRINNPDDKPLEVRGLSCELKISGPAFADGSSDEHVSVPASGSAVAQVLIYTSVFDIAGSVIEMLQRSSPPAKPLAYELTGRLRAGEKGEETVPFALKGSLPLDKE